MSKTIQANNFFGKENTINNIVIVGENISNPENIGSFLRLAGNFGISKVYIITDNLPNKRKIARTASTAKNQVELIKTDIEILDKLKAENYKIIAVETAENAVNIRNYKFPEGKVVLLLGNESYGLSTTTIKKASDIIYINMYGPVKSMNVSQALAITLYECSYRME